MWYHTNNESLQFVNFVEENYPPGWTYPEFAPQFTAELWNATAWAQLFQQVCNQITLLTLLFDIIDWKPLFDSLEQSTSFSQASIMRFALSTRACNHQSRSVTEFAAV